MNGWSWLSSPTPVSWRYHGVRLGLLKPEDLNWLYVLDS
jgi:hypothetical protein